METEVLKIDPNLPPEELLASPAVQEAAYLLQQGEVVALPTETVYGLAGDAFNPGAVKKIFAAKGRPADNPLIVHIAEHQDIYQLIPKAISPTASKLISNFWPGPLTLILPKVQELPEVTTAGLDTVAVRMPSHPVIRAILFRSGLTLAAPSANSSGFPSPTRATHVQRDLTGKIPLIIDGGACSVGLESTVLDLTRTSPVLLRPGAVTAYQIEEVLGIKVERKYDIMEDEAPRSPGMKYKHYSPEAEVILLVGDDPASIWREACKCSGRRALLISNETSREINELLIEKEVTLAEDCAQGELEIVEMGSFASPELIARRLFALLRDMDNQGFSTLLIEEISDIGVGEAVMNRLLRAASKIIKID
ncbi:MAG: L-threonylcarbamoyladenylate synthase [Bacillota bacterium]